MNLKEEITRIKCLMMENILDYIIQTDGDIQSVDGMKVSIMTPSNDYFGETNIIGFQHALD